MNSDSDPPLPRSAEDDDNIRRLRRDALRRLDEEERANPAPVFGGPPAPVYGGPPPNFRDDGPVTRRWTLGRILLVAGGAIAAIFGVAYEARRIVAPVYGGPPAPNPPVPLPPTPPAPVYGGPVPIPAPEPEPPAPKKNGHLMHKPHVPVPEKPAPDHPVHRVSPAAVYGGPPPRPPG